MTQTPAASAAEQGDLPIRHRPQVAEIFKQAEARAFKDEELELLVQYAPEIQAETEAAQAVRGVSGKLIKKVVQEVYAIYPYEKYHQYAQAKCIRDVSYVVSYAVAAMIARDPQWYEDKLLLWLKTILQAFDFPDFESRKFGNLVFKDQTLQQELSKRPAKARGIYHTYYRLDQMMKRELEEKHHKMISPYILQAMRVLTEDY
jgi:hypothetical protein